MGVRPLGDRVLVKPVEQEERTKGGIVLPDTAKEKPVQGEVIAVGPGAMTEEGERIPIAVKAGDRVIYGKYAGTKVEIDGEEYLIVRESDILARIGE